MELMVILTLWIDILLQRLLQLWDWLSSTDSKTSGKTVGIRIQKWQWLKWRNQAMHRASDPVSSASSSCHFSVCKQTQEPAVEKLEHIPTHGMHGCTTPQNLIMTNSSSKQTKEVTAWSWRKCRHIPITGTGTDLAHTSLSKPKN